MAMPFRRAVSMMSSSGRPTTVLPLSLNSIGSVASCFELTRSITLPPLANFAGEVLHDAERRVRRRLAQAADRGIHHGLREFREQRLVPLLRIHELQRLGGAHAAGGALAAGLVPEKFHQV